MIRNIRPHSKSRKGCLNCKVRRVKCDELKPMCSACARRSDACVYLSRMHRTSSTQGSDQSTVPSSTIPLIRTSELAFDIHHQGPTIFDYGSNHLMQLRLMHHYGTTTVKSFAVAFQLQERLVQSLQVDVPSFAFKHSFLLDTVLLVAMIHMASMEPQSVNMLDVATYRNQAICAVRAELASISDENIRAIRMSSLLLGVTSFAADRVMGYSGIWLTNSLALTIGSRTFMPHGTGDQADTHADDMQLGDPTCSFGNFQTLSSIPLSLQMALQINEEEDDWAYYDDLYLAASGIGKLFDSLHRPHTRLSIAFELKSWPFFYVSEGFVQLARQEQPRALIIMAYYLVFLQYFPAVWLYEDVVRKDMEKIAESLGPEWHEYLSVPMAAVLIEGESLLTEFLLMQVPKGTRTGLTLASICDATYMPS
ncbi:fungal Zn binuclear cluster domain-containing protein [Ilyonectria destructans]|nr:fungal Zn binuclear cluster domain-containing protein [Ilyonectria destructans]